MASISTRRHSVANHTGSPLRSLKPSKSQSLRQFTERHATEFAHLHEHEDESAREIRLAMEAASLEHARKVGREKRRSMASMSISFSNTNDNSLLSETVSLGQADGKENRPGSPDEQERQRILRAACKPLGLVERRHSKSASLTSIPTPLPMFTTPISNVIPRKPRPMSIATRPTSIRVSLFSPPTNQRAVSDPPPIRQANSGLSVLIECASNTSLSSSCRGSVEDLVESPTDYPTPAGTPEGNRSENPSTYSWATEFSGETSDLRTTAQYIRKSLDLPPEQEPTPTKIETRRKRIVALAHTVRQLEGVGSRDVEDPELYDKLEKAWNNSVVGNTDSISIIDSTGQSVGTSEGGIPETPFTPFTPLQQIQHKNTVQHASWLHDAPPTFEMTPREEEEAGTASISSHQNSDAASRVTGASRYSFASTLHDLAMDGGIQLGNRLMTEKAWMRMDEESRPLEQITLPSDSTIGGPYTPQTPVFPAGIRSGKEHEVYNQEIEVHEASVVTSGKTLRKAKGTVGRSTPDRTTEQVSSGWGLFGGWWRSAPSKLKDEEETQEGFHNGGEGIFTRRLEPAAIIQNRSSRPSSSILESPTLSMEEKREEEEIQEDEEEVLTEETRQSLSLNLYRNTWEKKQIQMKNDFPTHPLPISPPYTPPTRVTSSLKNQKNLEKEEKKNPKEFQNLIHSQQNSSMNLSTTLLPQNIEFRQCPPSPISLPSPSTPNNLPNPTVMVNQENQEIGDYQHQVVQVEIVQTKEVYSDSSVIYSYPYLSQIKPQDIPLPPSPMEKPTELPYMSETSHLPILTMIPASPPQNVNNRLPSRMSSLPSIPFPIPFQYSAPPAITITSETTSFGNLIRPLSIASTFTEESVGEEETEESMEMIMTGQEEDKVISDQSMEMSMINPANPMDSMGPVGKMEKEKMKGMDKTNSARCSSLAWSDIQPSNISATIVGKVMTKTGKKKGKGKGEVVRATLIFPDPARYSSYSALALDSPPLTPEGQNDESEYAAVETESPEGSLRSEEETPDRSPSRASKLETRVSQLPPQDKSLLTVPKRTRPMTSATLLSITSDRSPSPSPHLNMSETEKKPIYPKVLFWIGFIIPFVWIWAAWVIYPEKVNDIEATANGTRATIHIGDSPLDGRISRISKIEHGLTRREKLMRRYKEKQKRRWGKFWHEDKWVRRSRVASVVGSLGWVIIVVAVLVSIR
ncbi:hypothetical protein TREMEDRAFT_73617 [Tremella mesenterica DSM 1558]|uniref:uncharacterized protein n=1 Tax=Tremella mesenterica (strain ATCC 24925 / CBS 8224 / DSM 1558 / NBRC 9311 / NRRL Y-6157 / RJB 2259-6 / UBC 559-6) TaxID=578456 RepID=UPI0003F4A0C2|nr:uncharacterized protein TREMEDRAFT_73617 [Tremella mesenterica DSM 1558]EIW69789.1 hypothetical protein TREMEDRAFT_73617 [Tremella mesenterica DSM 1558]